MAGGDEDKAGVTSQMRVTKAGFRAEVAGWGRSQDRSAWPDVRTGTRDSDWSGASSLCASPLKARAQVRVILCWGWSKASRPQPGFRVCSTSYFQMLCLFHASKPEGNPGWGVNRPRAAPPCSPAMALCQVHPKVRWRSCGWRAGCPSAPDRPLCSSLAQAGRHPKQRHSILRCCVIVLSLEGSIGLWRLV